MEQRAANSVCFHLPAAAGLGNAPSPDHAPRDRSLVTPGAPRPTLCRCEEPTERTMPHVIVKLYSGRSEQQKARLAEDISKIVMANLKEKSVSVGIEDVKPQDWAEKVYKPAILGNPETIYKKLGYNQLSHSLTG